MTDELEATRNVGRAAPPPLVEPPAPARVDATAPVVVPPRDEPAPGPSVGAPAHGPTVGAPAAPAPAAPAPEVPAPEAPAAPAPLGPYRLRMTDGVVVNLDLTVYLGRRPSVPRVASDRRVRLVAVPSARKEVSATHLEVRLAGDAVVATDMRSTNGSIVTVPGSAPRTLLRGESAVVPPGSFIDLGDGNLIEVLPRERLVPEEDGVPA